MSGARNEVVVVEAKRPIATVAQLAERAANYAEAARSPNTQTAYASDWKTFVRWCDRRGEKWLPASQATVTAFLVDTAGTVTVSTQRRRLSAIKDAQRRAGHHLDITAGIFQDVWKGIRRAHAAPPVKKAPLVTTALRRAIESLPDTVVGVRDRALLLVGFAGALRRAELSAVEVKARTGADWIEETGEGLIVHLSQSKGDQEGQGQTVGIP